jgi:glucose/arabinose dehydrogenase
MRTTSPPRPSTASRVASRPLARAAALGLALVVAACASGPSSGGPSSGGPSSAPPGPGGSSQPPLPAVALEEIATGLAQPLFVTSSDDGRGSLYVAEQGGRVRIIRDGQLLATPFLDIADRVTAGGEQGLLGLAFPPDWGEVRWDVYAHYSGADGETVIAAFTTSTDNPDVADAASERIVLREPQPYANHNGGWIGFDREGLLLIALGDGGSGGDPENRASNPESLLGKILRIDVSGVAAGEPYAIPPGNPYANSGGRPEILHSGLRNPFRASIDPPTGDLWIGDVGQNAWEEVDVARAGAAGLDFGWRRWEGRHCYDPPFGCDGNGVTQPVAEYSHDLRDRRRGLPRRRDPGPARPLPVLGLLLRDAVGDRRGAGRRADARRAAGDAANRRGDRRRGGRRGLPRGPRRSRAPAGPGQLT